MQIVLAAMLDYALDLCQCDAGGGMVDVGVWLFEIECSAYGGSEVVVVGGRGSEVAIGPSTE